MKKMMIAAMLLVASCGAEGGDINSARSKKMDLEIVKSIRFARIPQLNNVCIAYAWFGNDYGGPMAFTIPCDSMATIPSPCAQAEKN
jgi:hypothetical protein